MGESKASVLIYNARRHSPQPKKALHCCRESPIDTSGCIRTQHQAVAFSGLN
jgi:hypothetical protein